MTVTQAARAEATALTSLPDLQPFNIDPVLLGPLRGARARPQWISAAVPVLIFGLVVWAAAAGDLLFWRVTPQALWADVWNFIAHRPSAEAATVPLLRDYPSIVLTCTIAAAVALVYHLYGDAAKLHSDLEKSGCVTVKDANRAELTQMINEVNERLSRWGRFSPLAFVLALILMVLVNLSMQAELFAFLGPGLYQHWWASLTPLRPGGIVWVVFGGIGIYMVYVEAVLGLTYVSFLRRLHRQQKYDFTANPLNPDGFFGWSRLRQVITNLQAGLVCTLLSAWTFSFFLLPSVGTVATVVVLLIFVGIVVYVYFSVETNFRRQVNESKNEQALQVGARISRQLAAVEQRFDVRAPLDGVPRQPGRDDPHLRDTDRLLLLLVSYRQLEYISMIPNTPIRQKWLIAGVLSLLGTLSAIVIPLLEYFQ
ncbi:hypothetical protein [Catellatospora vulcania]|uniref:hypothetical protein n=1 Tax=Catellatospora vulcania TaxID=1460450 RepID=UPI0012D44B1F|nr:hypothetical protein [Catellatospora vulcania]